MISKERILLALRGELEPLGFRYLKSKKEFRKKANKDICVCINYNAGCYHRGFIDVMISVCAKYADIDRAIREIKDLEPIDYGSFSLRCRLQHLLPGGDAGNPEYYFQDTDSEEVNTQILTLLLFQARTYLIPYTEKLSYTGGALEVAIELDQEGMVHPRCAVPMMYCIWRHDKKAALDYLEEIRQRMYNLVTPQEWALMERMKNGEEVPRSNKPFNAIFYEEFLESAEKFKEWMERQDY